VVMCMHESAERQDGVFSTAALAPASDTHRCFNRARAPAYDVTPFSTPVSCQLLFNAPYRTAWPSSESAAPTMVSGSSEAER